MATNPNCNFAGTSGQSDIVEIVGRGWGKLLMWGASGTLGKVQARPSWKYDTKIDAFQRYKTPLVEG